MGLFTINCYNDDNKNNWILWNVIPLYLSEQLRVRSIASTQPSRLSSANEDEAHYYSDDNRYDLVECGAACQPTLDLSEQLQVMIHTMGH